MSDYSEMSKRFAQIAADVFDERLRQEKQHAPDTCAGSTLTSDGKLVVIVEEIDEVARAIMEDGNLREELIQVAACAMAWVEAIDRG